MDYLFKNASLNEIIALFDKLLNVRITFFDAYNAEMHDLNIPPKYSYCRERRQNPEFDTECRKCDARHLKLAKEHKDIHIYKCHAGLIEAIVPIYDKADEYLGALFFGEMRDEEEKSYQIPAQYRNSFARTPQITLDRTLETAKLLKLISEYIISHELIKYRQEKWVEILRDCISRRLKNPPSIAEMGRLVHFSESFISHNFHKHFGCSPKKYIQNERMKKAKIMLAQGKKVFEAAAETGFYDEFHFSKAFKKHFGHPPSK